MTTEKRGPSASYYKIHVDGWLVAVYKLSEETPYHSRIRKLIGTTFQPATEDEYLAWLKRNARQIRRGLGVPDILVKS